MTKCPIEASNPHKTSLFYGTLSKNFWPVSGLSVPFLCRFYSENEFLVYKNIQKLTSLAHFFKKCPIKCPINFVPFLTLFKISFHHQTVRSDRISYNCVFLAILSLAILMVKIDPAEPVIHVLIAPSQISIPLSIFFTQLDSEEVIEVLKRSSGSKNEVPVKVILSNSHSLFTRPEPDSRINIKEQMIAGFSLIAHRNQIGCSGDGPHSCVLDASSRPQRWLSEYQ